MQDKNIAKAGQLARRFLEAVAAERDARVSYEHNGRTITSTNPKFTGALRRVSMDLTRALAEMRKP